LRQNKNNSLTSYIDYVLYPCVKEQDENCVDYDDYSFDTIPYWDLVVKLQDVDISSGSIIDFHTEYVFDISAQQSMTISVKIVKATLIVDDGWLWSSFT
jgi:hypothetical protein